MSEQTPEPELAGDPVHQGPDDMTDTDDSPDQDAEPPTPDGQEPDVDAAGAEHPDP